VLRHAQALWVQREEQELRTLWGLQWRARDPTARAHPTVEAYTDAQRTSHISSNYSYLNCV